MNLEGKKCAVCSAYLFEDDDVVFCPECGAPHHRDCYKAMGRCGLSELHGTAEQYKSEPSSNIEEQETSPSQKTEDNRKSCPFCGREVDTDAVFCPYCRGRVTPMPQFNAGMGFEVIDANEELDEGVTAGDALKTVTVNGGRYISRFKQFKEGKKTSWNWAAFLLPHGWLAFRKMYLLAALVASLMVASSLLTVPLLIAENNAAIVDTANSAEIMKQMAVIMSEAGPVPLICTFIGMAISLATRVVFALFGDYLYKNRVVSAVKDINATVNPEEAIRKKGGVSVLGFFVAVFLQNLILQIIAGFLM